MTVFEVCGDFNSNQELCIAKLLTTGSLAKGFVENGELFLFEIYD